MRINRRTLLAAGAALTLFCLAGVAMAEGIATSAMPKEGIILTATVKAKPGQEGAVKEALMEMVEPTRKEKGCLAYNLHQSKSDKAQFIFYEQWASQAALDAHMKSPHMKALGDKLKDKTEKVDIVYYELLK
jgi:quinol monooxygenase YgiN